MNSIKEKIINCYSKYKEIINYIIFGVLTTIVNYIVYILSAKVIKLEVIISTFVAWFISVLFAYFTNRKYVFKSKVTKKLALIKELVSFICFRILSGVIDIVIMYVSVDLMHLNDLVMKLVANVIIIALNYLFSKIFIFNNKESKEEHIACNSLDTNDAPVNIFRYIIQLVMLVATIYITYLNINLVTLIATLLLFIIVEIILESSVKSKCKKTERKKNTFKNILNFLGKNFHYVIFVIAFTVRLILYFKLKIIPVVDFAVLLDTAKDLVNGINSMNDSSYFEFWGYQSGMVIYNAVVLGIFGGEIWLHIFDCIYGATITLFIYLIAKELFSKQSGIIVSLLYCVGIYVSAFCGVLTNHHIFTVFILFAVYLLIAKKYENMNYILKYSIVAVLLATGNIFRSESILYILAVLGYIFINSLSKKEIKKSFIAMLSVVFIYLLITRSASWIIKTTGINESGLTNKDPLWKFVCGTDYRVNGGYSEEGVQYLGNSDKEIKFIKDNLNILSLRQKIQLVEAKEREFWSNIPYYWVFSEQEGKQITIFNKTYSFSKILSFINIYDLTIFLFCAVNMLILVLYSKVRNLEDKRLYLLYLMILANFFVYIFIEVNGRYSYVAKIIVYILAAGGIEIFKRNAEKEYENLEIQ